MDFRNRLISQNSDPHVRFDLNRNNLIKEFKDVLDEYSWLAFVDGPGKGKTQLAASIYQTIIESPHKWISLRNKGNLTKKHFRDQLVSWLAQSTGQVDVWILYISGLISFTEIII